MAPDNSSVFKLSTQLTRDRQLTEDEIRVLKCHCQHRLKPELRFCDSYQQNDDSSMTSIKQASLISKSRKLIDERSKLLCHDGAHTDVLTAGSNCRNDLFLDEFPWTSSPARASHARMWFTPLLVGLTCLLVLLGQSESRPMLEETARLYQDLEANTMKYLMQFGYLTVTSKDAENLINHEHVTSAIVALQIAGGIPATGVPDARTMELMQRPRCGNTDGIHVVVSDRGGKFGRRKWRRRRRRYTIASSKWPRTNLTFRFVNYTPDMPQAVTRQVIGDALKVWSDVTPLRFTEVRDSSADIMMLFASQHHYDRYPFDGKGMVLGHAFFPGNGIGGDTHFDDDETWTTNSSDGVNLFMVAVHEFGHSLGLAHSGNPGSLMYPWYMGTDSKFQLPEDDIEGITFLYGTGEQDRHLPDKAKVNLMEETHNPNLTDSTPQSGTSEDEVDKKGPPDPCKSHFDALTVIGSEIFLFIGKWFWRLDSRRLIPKPIEIHQFWLGLPEHVDKVDAVFQRSDNKIVFFSGESYWIFNGNQLSSGFPSEGRSITEFNIPAEVKKIDSAFVWGYNKRTYMTSGDMYWKMNAQNNFAEYDYPRKMSTWKGVPVPLDAAFQDFDGRTYFFQGLDFWQFYDMKMQVHRGYPKRISQHWLSCSVGG